VPSCRRWCSGRSATRVLLQEPAQLTHPAHCLCPKSGNSSCRGLVSAPDSVRHRRSIRRWCGLPRQFAVRNRLFGKKSLAIEETSCLPADSALLPWRMQVGESPVKPPGSCCGRNLRSLLVRFRVDRLSVYERRQRGDH
jgi:hypothetical protein